MLREPPGPGRVTSATQLQDLKALVDFLEAARLSSPELVRRSITIGQNMLDQVLRNERIDWLPIAGEVL